MMRAGAKTVCGTYSPITYIMLCYMFPGMRSLLSFRLSQGPLQAVRSGRTAAD